MDAIKNNTRWEFLAEPYASMEAEALLSYFQSRSAIRHFPLSKGTRDHVEKADKIIENIFSFNNETYRLPNHFDWKINPSRDIEWLILLHKFYFTKDLGAAYEYTGDEKYAEKWVELLLSWIENVPEGFINSQVTGRRVQQWVLSYRYFISQKPSPAIRPYFLIEFLRSIYLQTLYLTKNLTDEGNHRTIELYAIFLIATLFPEMRDAEWFLAFSKEEILKNMQQDLLLDGVQRELSPDYHHTVLKNYLRIRELASLNQISLPIECDNLIKKALEFSLYVHKPDGFIPAVSDGDRNSYLSLFKKGFEYYRNENLLYALSRGKEGTPPPCRSKGFRESGYYILRSDWMEKPYDEGLYFFFDCGPLGAGSHGHYDLLNFEMAAYGHSLIVDPGRYTYSEESDDGVNWRKTFKGTAYHNTVLVDGKDQISYRRGKPIDREPKAVLKEFTTAEGFDFIAGRAVSHEYPVVHDRNVFFLPPEYWIISDRLQGEGSHSYTLYFHLQPSAFDQTIIGQCETTTRVTSPNLLIAQPRVDGIRAAIEAGFISPEYGVKQEAPIVTFSQNSSGPALFQTLLYPYRTKQPDIYIEELPVYHQAVLCPKDEVTALKITIDGEDASYSDYFFLAHGAGLKEYRFEEIVYKGQLLFLRKNRQNHISNLQANHIEFIRVKERVVLDLEGFQGRVSYQNKALHCDTDAVTFQVDLDDLQKVVRARRADFKVLD